MEKSRSKLTLLSLALLAFSIGACSKYSDHYSAEKMEKINTNTTAKMSFDFFRGTMSFELECKEESRKSLMVHATLKEGLAEAFIDSGNGKEKLATIKGGTIGTLDKNDLPVGPIYIVVESAENCYRGEFGFYLT